MADRETTLRLHSLNNGELAMQRLRKHLGSSVPIPSKFPIYLAVGGDEEGFINAIEAESRPEEAT